MTNVQFLRCIFAHLGVDGSCEIDPRNPSLHKAVASVAEIIGKSELRRLGVVLYVDPITETIADVYNVISTLQGSCLATRPNPTYPTTSISGGKRVLAETLRPLGKEERSIVTKFADALRLKLSMN
jgi:hypothetical protein